MRSFAFWLLIGPFVLLTILPVMVVKGWRASHSIVDYVVKEYL